MVSWAIGYGVVLFIYMYIYIYSNLSIQSIHLSLCAMEYDHGTPDHIAGGTCDESDMAIDLDESDIDDHVNDNTATSVHSETYGDDADVGELATTDPATCRNSDSDCELVACTFRPYNNGYEQHSDHGSDSEFESPAFLSDNDNYNVSTHPHRRSIEFNESNPQPQPALVVSRGGDGDAAAGPSQSHSNNLGNNDDNDNSGSGSDWDDSDFDRLGYHFCSDCIQCGKCEVCGYVLRMRRPAYFPAPSLGHSCVYQRHGRHHCDACWLVGMCDVCGDTLRDYRPNHDFSD